MKKSAKKIQVDSCIKTRFALRQVKCNCCSAIIQFEIYYSVNEPEHASLHIARYCKSCVKSREEAFDLAFNKSITAANLAVENEIRYLRHLVEQAGEKIVVAEQALKYIITEALNKPDIYGPDQPFVMLTVVKAEETIRKLEE